MKQSRILAQAALPGLLALSAAVHAANECKVEYGYHTGSGFNRQDKTETVFVNAGSSKTVNRSQMNYVKSLKNHQIKVILQGAATVTLGQNQINPAVGFYLTPVTLKTLQCLTQSSTQQSGFATPQALVAALKAANTAVNEIAKQLKNTFNQTGAQVAALLKAAGYSAAQIAGALNSAFNATAEMIAPWLKAAGYTAEQVIAALKSGANATAQQAAGAVKAAFGLGQSSLAQVGAWLKSVGYAAEQVAAGLKAAFNATAAQVATVLKSLYNANAQQLAQWLKNAGFTLAQVADALALSDLGYKIADIINALKSRFNASADQIVQTLKQLQKLITTQNCGAAGCRQPAEYLKAAGYAAGEALKALRTHFNLGVQGAHDIAKNVFGLAGQALEQALAFAGYTAQQIAGTVARMVQNPTTAGVVIDCVVPTDRICNAPDRRQPPMADGLLVSYGSNLLRFKILGKNLQGVNGVRGLPARQVDLSSSIGQINVSAHLNQTGANWSGPASGTAQLTVNGQPVAGGTFAWRFTIDRTARTPVPPQVIQGYRCTPTPANNYCRP